MKVSTDAYELDKAEADHLQSVGNVTFHNQ